MYRSVSPRCRSRSNAHDFQISPTTTIASVLPIDPWGCEGGRVYSTAMMALCLEASNE